MYARIRTLICIVFATIVSCSVIARAQGTIGLDPVVNRFGAQPGQQITNTINIWNPFEGDTKLRVIGSLSDFQYSEGGRISFPKAGTLPRSAASWITFTPSELTLSPKERREVRYTVNVPAGAKPGSYWAVLFLEAENPEANAKNVLASFNVRVGHTIWVNVGPLTNTGEVSGIFEQAPKTETDPLGLTVQYNNTGNAAAIVNGRIELRDERGKLTATLPLTRVVSLPGQSTVMQLNWLGPAPAGKYTALAVLNNGSNTTDIVGEYSFTLPLTLRGEVPKAPAAAAPAQRGPAAPAATPPAPGGK